MVSSHPETRTLNFQSWDRCMPRTFGMKESLVVGNPLRVPHYFRKSREARLHDFTVGRTSMPRIQSLGAWLVSPAKAIAKDIWHQRVDTRINDVQCDILVSQS